MRRHTLPVLGLLLLAGCGQSGPAGDPGPHDFDLSLTVEARGTQVGQVRLPAAALVALKRPDLGDIRVFDAHDRALSIAPVAPRQTQVALTRLDAIPIDTAAGEKAAAPLSVRVDQQEGRLSIQTEGHKAQTSESAVLFDTRKIKDTAVSIALDAALPPQRAVTISISAGSDLKTWEPLAEQVFFRTGAGSQLLGGNRITLPPVTLKGRYLRASWTGAPEARIAAADLATSSLPVHPPVSIALRGLALSDSHSMVFDLPTAAQPKALRVRMAGADGVVPVRLYGRENGEAPWQLIAMASLRQGGAGALMDTGTSWARTFRLDADSRSAGFSRPPEIALLFDPVLVAAAFNGDGPYRLAVGNPDASPRLFALSELANGPAPLAEARVTGAPPVDGLDVKGASGGWPLPPKVMALWTSLLAGVALLSVMAFRLMRANADR